MIHVEGIGKRYRLGATIRHDTLRDLIAHRAKALFSRRRDTGDGKPDADAFWALKDVSFDVAEGEVVGIIGKNGAGKSTLLKILSRITPPTEGHILLNGRVASLLEVGTGFHPELSGRENVYLNGAILGMTRREIKAKFDEIVAFAEVEKFLDTPVKRYSSGMYVRLAFAVAAHLEPEILIVDEVLAVGDASFQKKCLGKMGEVAQGGRTVLFVSHNMGAVQALCSRAVRLQEGRCVECGPTTQVIDSYLAAVRGAEGSADIAEQPRRGDLGRRVRVTGCTIRNADGESTRHLKFGEPFSVTMECKGIEPVGGVHFVVGINSDQQNRITTLLSRDSLRIAAGEQRAASVAISGLYLNPGRYTLSLGLRQPTVGYDLVEFVSPFYVDEAAEDVETIRAPAIHYGFIQVPDSVWTTAEREMNV